MMRIVFSRDRAMQLDAFLRSYREHVRPLGKVLVLYRSTTERHAAAYREVFAEHEDYTEPYEEGDFRRDVLGLMSQRGTTVLFADDHLFLRRWDANDGEVGDNAVGESQRYFDRFGSARRRRSARFVPPKAE